MKQSKCCKDAILAQSKDVLYNKTQVISCMQVSSL